MTQSGSMPSPAANAAAERPIEAPELIDRLAERLRASSDVDLPHSYFVEQVQLGLGGIDITDQLVANDIEGSGRKQQKAVGHQKSVFHSWAMPD